MPLIIALFFQNRHLPEAISLPTRTYRGNKQARRTISFVSFVGREQKTETRGERTEDRELVLDCFSAPFGGDSDRPLSGGEIGFDWVCFLVHCS